MNNDFSDMRERIMLDTADGPFDTVEELMDNLDSEETDKDKNRELYQILVAMNVRPMMYFGTKEGSYEKLSLFLLGFSVGLQDESIELHWSDVQEETEYRFFKKIKGKEFSDSEKFRFFMDIALDEFHRKHPEYVV